MKKVTHGIFGVFILLMACIWSVSAVSVISGGASYTITTNHTEGIPTCPDVNYNDSGGELTDGLYDTSLYSDAAWVGCGKADDSQAFYTNLTVDLTNTYSISILNATYLDAGGSTNAPTWTEYFCGNASSWYSSLGNGTGATAGDSRKQFTLGSFVASCRFITVIAVQDTPNWIFQDEVEVWGVTTEPTTTEATTTTEESTTTSSSELSSSSSSSSSVVTTTTEETTSTTYIDCVGEFAGDYCNDAGIINETDCESVYGMDGGETGYAQCLWFEEGCINDELCVTTTTTTTTTTTLADACNYFEYYPCTDIPEPYCPYYYESGEGNYNCYWNETNFCLAEDEPCTIYCYGEELIETNCSELSGYECYGYYQLIEESYYLCELTYEGCIANSLCEIPGVTTTTTSTTTVTTTTTTIPNCIGTYTFNCMNITSQEECEIKWYPGEYFSQCVWSDGSCYYGRDECIANCNGEPLIEDYCGNYSNQTACENYYYVFEGYNYQCLWISGGIDSAPPLYIGQRGIPRDACIPAWQCEVEIGGGPTTTLVGYQQLSGLGEGITILAWLIGGLVSVVIVIGIIVITAFIAFTFIPGLFKMIMETVYEKI